MKSIPISCSRPLFYNFSTLFKILILVIFNQTVIDNWLGNNTKVNN